MKLRKVLLIASCLVAFAVPGVISDNATCIVAQAADSSKVGYSAAEYYESLGYTKWSSSALKQVDGVTYEGNMFYKNDDYVITDLKVTDISTSACKDGALVIPSTVEVNMYGIKRNCKVIGIDGFDESISKDRISSVTIPSTVGFIGDGAFKDFTGLENVIYEEISNIAYLGKEAFSNTGIKTLELPASLFIQDGSTGKQVFQKAVFAECKQLASVKIQNGESENVHVYIPDKAFSNCNALETLELGDNYNFIYIGYSAFENSGIRDLELSVNSIFNGITIKEKAFYGSGNLKSVSLYGKTSLEKECFANSFYTEKDVVKKINVHGGCTFGINCFKDSTGLSEVNFIRKADDYDGLTMGNSSYYYWYTVNSNPEVIFYYGAFDGTAIKKLNIDARIIKCATLCFSGMELEELTFNGKTLSLGGSMFFNDSKDLETVTINVESVTYNTTDPLSGINGYCVPESFSNPFSLSSVKNIIYTENVSYIMGNGGEGLSSTIENVYLYNPKTVVSYVESADREKYTVYGYMYPESNGEYNKYGATGMKLCNADNTDITYADIISSIKIVSYKGINKINLASTTDIIGGQNFEPNELKVNVYLEGPNNTHIGKSLLYNTENVYDGFLAYVMASDSNGIESQTTTFVAEEQNSINVKYFSWSDDVALNPAKLAVESFDSTFTKETATGKIIEGTTLSKKDFVVTNVVYNDKDKNITEAKDYNKIEVEALDADGNVIDFVFEGEDDEATKLTAGTNFFRVSYDGKVSDEIIEVKVEEKQLVTLKVVQTEASKAETKYVGDTVSEKDFLVTAIYDNGDEITNFLGYTIKNKNLTEAETELAFSAGNVTVPYVFKATPVSVTNIVASVEEGATAVEHGEIDKTLVTVIAGLNNGKTVELTADDFEFETYDIVAGKVNTITVVYQGAKASFNIKGVPANICGLEVISVQNVTADTPEKTYYIGDTVTKDDLYVTAVYNNGRKLENYKDYTIVQGTLEGNMNTIVVALNSDPSIKAECEFKAADIELEKIEVSYSGGDIPEGSKVNTDDIVVKAYYNNGNVKEIAAENYTIKDYAIVQGVKTTLTVVYNGKEASFEVKGTAAPTAVPTAEPTAVPTAEPTAVPTTEPTAVPTAEPTAVPTATPTAKAVVKRTQVATPTPEGKLSYKSSNSKIKLQSQSAKTTYKVYSKKAIKINVSMTNNEKVYYQIVKQGKKLGSKWTLAKNTITIKKNMKACVYIKYTQNGKTVIKKTSGFVFDKTAPKVSVTKKGKLKVTDSVSGIKKITVDGKKVRNGTKLSVGKHKVVAYDKAGNKKTVKVTVGEK